MPSPTRDEFPVVIKFGGGLNTRASEDDIQAIEAADGKNFRLDLRNRNLRPREPFDLKDTAPNAGQINGFAQLKKVDGTLTTLVQAGNNVYSWTGSSFTLQGTVANGTKIRGPLTQNYLLDDVVVITDLAGVNPVLQWDGTTLSTMTHNLSGDFIARYAFTHNDRMWYAYVTSNGTVTPHVVVASKLEDYDNLSVTDKPASASGADDPFFMTAPDLRPINGFVEAFDRAVISTGPERGNIYQITGLTAGSSGDYAINPLYPNSGAAGDEPFIFIGNDIAYGRQGVIESLQRTDRFGDVETDDLSVPVADRISGVDAWTACYNQRLKRAYFFPDGTSEIWVLFKPLLDEGRISPWSKYTTGNAATFTPTATMCMLDPDDGLEYLYFGDSSGNIYRLEGTGTGGDAGSTDITTEWLSGLIRVPDEAIRAKAHTVDGYIQYRKNEAATVTLTFEFSGESAYDQPITITIPGISGRPTYGGTSYYGGTDYYNVPFNQKLVRQIFAPPGQATQFQVRVSSTGTTDFEINEIGLRLEAATE